MLGSGIGGEGCAEGIGKVDEVISWLSLAVIIVAIIFIAVAVVIIERHTQQKTAKMKQDIKPGKRRAPQKATSRSLRAALLNNNSI